jgi:hypothetical protein
MTTLIASCTASSSGSYCPSTSSRTVCDFISPIQQPIKRAFMSLERIIIETKSKKVLSNDDWLEVRLGIDDVLRLDCHYLAPEVTDTTGKFLVPREPMKFRILGSSVSEKVRSAVGVGQHLKDLKESCRNQGLICL